MRESGRLDLAPIRPVSAIGHNVDAELALWRFDCGISTSGWHLVALRVELEVVDQRFHRVLRKGKA